MLFKDYIEIMHSELNSNSGNKPIFIWLLILTFMTFLMIIVGGLTRLTGSGLSMVDWQPIMGAIPPLNDQDWLIVFSSYQNSPEYQIVNMNMNLNEFKYTYFNEVIEKAII